MVGRRVELLNEPLSHHPTARIVLLDRRARLAYDRGPQLRRCDSVEGGKQCLRKQERVILLECRSHFSNAGEGELNMLRLRVDSGKRETNNAAAICATVEHLCRHGARVTLPTKHLGAAHQKRHQFGACFASRHPLHNAFVFVA